MTEATEPPPLGIREALCAVFLLFGLLTLTFLPAILGDRTLLLSARDVPSILNSGAYGSGQDAPRVNRSPDPYSPAWLTEPLFKVISNQLWAEHSLPLWNPYNAFGTPLAAAAQPQPFFPLATTLSLNVTPWTYNLFILSRILLAAALMFIFARFFFAPYPSFIAAIAFMLSGYFILYLNIAHLSVEVLIPGFLIAVELLIRKRSWTAAAVLALMILFGMTAGMPESLFLILVFVSLYFISRLLFDPALRLRPASLLTKYVGTILLGIALSGFLLFPTLEFISLAHDIHQPANIHGHQTGLAAEHDYRRTRSISDSSNGWPGMAGSVSG